MAAHPLYDRAALYEAAFSWDPAPEAAFYDAVLGPGRILDIGCGTGRVLGALAARGRDAVGFDRSAAMVARARARGLAAFVADMRDFALARPCAAALSHLSTFRYLLEDRDVAAHLDAVAAALPARGARYAIDHDLVGADFDPAHPGQTWRARAGGLEVEATWRVVGAPRGGLLREEALFRAEAVEVRVEEELRAWTLAGFERAIAAHGAFAIERWYAPPFEVAAPFAAEPWTPRDETRRVVTVLARR
jgi:SAM-dependent methyltransferase